MLWTRLEPKCLWMQTVMWKRLIVFLFKKKNVKIAWSLIYSNDMNKNVSAFSESLFANYLKLYRMNGSKTNKCLAQLQCGMPAMECRDEKLRVQYGFYIFLL